MGCPVVTVDLARPPAEHWDGLRSHVPAMRELAEMYERDLALVRPFRELVEAYRAMQSAELLAELDAIATMAELDPVDLFLVNAYYDVFKHAMACTAFALDTPDGPLHARNLDWHTERDALSRHTVVVRYVRGGALVFESAGWPGFVGTLSGVAPGRFSVTLNAVLSDDPAGVAPPIAWQLREALTTLTWADAVRTLERAPIACDCLLVVAGTKPGELGVIERAPGRAAVRRAEHGVVVATNDYRLLPESPSSAPSVLAATSCGRFERAEARVHAERPSTPEGCLAILDDAGVKMEMTVQQMVFSARRGVAVVRPGR